MTPETIESENAARTLAFVQRLAIFHSAPGDRDAVAVAILARAIEMATPGWTPANSGAPICLVAYSKDDEAVLHASGLGYTTRSA